MTTYNTGSPVGSTDPRDLYDNAQNLDALVNSTTELSHADRLGVQRKTWNGMEVEFAQFLADSAYQDLGVYGAGIEVTRYNQVFLKDGEFYRAAASLGLPYTTTGVWASESGSFVGVGDAVLRQDLGAPGGSDLVGYDSGTAQDVLDEAKPIANYTALRSYTGRATGVRITQTGLAGFFQRDDADTISADNGGTVIVDASGRRWKRLFTDAVNVEWFGAKGDWNGTTGTDDTTAFNAAITATPEYGTLVISGGKYLVRGTVNVTNKNINIECSGTIILTDEVNSRVNFTNTDILTFAGTALSVLPKIGDSTLQWTTAPEGIDDASKYFFVLNSTEEEITRVGSSAYTPYTKNECGDITSWGWLLRAAIKLDYTDASKLTVKLYRKRSPVTVRGLRVVMANTMGATSKLSRVVLIGLSNVNFDGLEVDSTAVNIAGQAVRIENCCGLTFSNSACIGPSAAGDSYGFINDTSAFITFNNCEYRNPYNAALKVERGYSARHGANITIRNCRFNGVDDHYGHDYLVENMTFNYRGVTFAGGNMTIKNCTHSGPRGLFEIRPDAPYAYGTLRIDGCVADGAGWLVSCSNDTDSLGRGTKVKYFDTIEIENTVINGRLPASSMYFKQYVSGVNTLYKTKLLRLKNIVHNKLVADIRCALFGEQNSPTPSARWVERAEFIDVDYRLIVTKTTGSFSEITSVSLRDLWADDVYVRNFKNFIPYGNPQIGRMTVIDSYIGPATGTNVWIPAGKCDFKSCEIDTPFVSLSGSTAVFTFTDCTINTALYGTSADSVELKTKTAFLSRNKATPAVNLANVPAGGLEYYINPTYYKTA